MRRAVVLMGPRRVGKTVLLHHTVQKLLAEGVNPRSIGYASIDHPLYNGLALDELVAMIGQASGFDPEREHGFVFFDEIQYLKRWEVHLKTLVDSRPNLKIVASGSAAAALRLKSDESGAGRFTDFLLPPLTFHEYLELLPNRVEVSLEAMADETSGFRLIAPDIDTLNDEFLRYLNFGGYPEALSSPAIQADPARFIKSDIVDKVLLRDLPSLYGIQDIQELNSLFTTLAFNTAQEVRLEDLSKRPGVAKNTLKRYIEYLEAAFLIKVVHRIDRNARRFQRANYFKVYLTNPSIRSALFSTVGPEDEVVGSLAETAALSQWFHSGAVLHYARWDKGEVDLVMLGGDQKPEWAAEIKWSDRVVDHPEDLVGQIQFCNEHSLKQILVTTRSVWVVKNIRGVSVEYQPASIYCYLLGRNILESKWIGGILGRKPGSPEVTRTSRR